MLEIYSPDQTKMLTAFSNTVVSSQQLSGILEDSRADVLTIFWGEDKNQVLLDKKFIKTLHKIGFNIYLGLIKDGLHEEVRSILEDNGIHQEVNVDRLMEIDKEYMTGI